MAISSSLYSSISGLSTMGEAMSVLGDNVANVNTVAFKSSRSTFQDVLAQSVSTAAGTAQVGRGVTLSAIDGLFAQGSFESSSTSTDLAIGGQGFFMLRASDSSEADMYSRAGEFRFDKEGKLINPVGHFAQGWSVSTETGEREGTIGDITLGKSTPPVASTTVEVIANLDSRETNEANEDRLFANWNGVNAAAVNPTDPIDSTKYDYTTAIKIYDSKGASHDLSVYFDRTGEDNQWEFLVTCDPTEDLRALNTEELVIYNPDTRYNYQNHKGAGALLYGTIQFDTSGNLTQIDAFKVPPDGMVDPAKNDNRLLLSAGDSYFSFPTNFTGATTNQEIELNFGVRYEGTSTTSRQTLVSESGARAEGAGGDVSSFITSATTWSSVADSNGNSIIQGDTFIFEGLTNGSDEITRIVYVVDPTLTIQDMLDQLESAFGCSASIDAVGRLVLTDNTAGDSSMFVTRFETISANASLPFGGTTSMAGTWSRTSTGITTDGTTLVTTASTVMDGLMDRQSTPEAIAAGDSFAYTGFDVNGDVIRTGAANEHWSRGVVTSNGTALVTTDTTALIGLQGRTTGAIAAGDTFTLTGTTTGNVAVNSTFTVAIGNDIDDLLNAIEAAYGLNGGDASLDATNGNILIQNSNLAGDDDLLINIAYSGSGDPWGLSSTATTLETAEYWTPGVITTNGTTLETTATNGIETLQGTAAGAIAATDTFTFTGTQVDGTAPGAAYTVGVGDTIQTFLTAIEGAYGLNAGDVSLGSRGNIVIKNSTGKGALSVIVTYNDQTGASTGANPWGLVDDSAITLKTTNQFTLDSLTTIQNMLTYSQNLYENGDAFSTTLSNTVTTSLDENGNLRFAENVEAGLMDVIIQFTDAVGGPSEPWGLAAGINDLSDADSMQGLIDITTSKQMIMSPGRSFSTNTGDTTPITATTQLNSVYDDASPTPRQLAAGDTITFTGTKRDGTSVNTNNTYTVPTNFTNTDGTPADMQDILDFVEGIFECEASIDTAGRLVMTDRVADTVSSSSSLQVTGITYGTNTNGHDIFGPASTAFDVIPADVSSEDGSIYGDVVTVDFEPEALSTTQYANSSTTIFQDQNGFSSGFLQSVSVDVDGVITGHYSNGQVLKKAQVALANFSNLAGLQKDGGNVYSETTDSGAPVTGAPGTNGLGSIAPNALEQSNVDLGSEFVKLITVQRGFQANSKIITTTDDMLNDLINIKR